MMSSLQPRHSPRTAQELARAQLPGLRQQTGKLGGEFAKIGGFGVRLDRGLVLVSDRVLVLLGGGFSYSGHYGRGTGWKGAEVEGVRLCNLRSMVMD